MSWAELCFLTHCLSVRLNAPNPEVTYCLGMNLHVCVYERKREKKKWRNAEKRVSVSMSMWTERDQKYVDECGLSHPQTNQQRLGNKNVLSVIVNYKYWSSPYCSLLIMLNGLPLTIMKPLTHCVSVCTCMCVYMCVREKVSMPAYLRKYAIVFWWPWRLQCLYMFAVCLQFCLWCLRPKWREQRE